MVRMLRTIAVLSVLGPGTAAAQTPSASLEDSAVQDSNAVSAYNIRSGKLMLSSKANPKPIALPDGTYANQSGVILVFMDGRVARVQESTDEITEIESMRLNNQRLVRLMPSTNALMAVTEFSLPSGTFTSEDGRNSVTIVFGRPTAFMISGGT